MGTIIGTTFFFNKSNKISLLIFFGFPTKPNFFFSGLIEIILFF